MSLREIILGMAVFAVLAGGCQKAPPRPGAPHPRIVSASPLLTDLIFQMGLGDHVVGVSAYCMPPEPREIVTDRQSTSSEKLLWAKPDIVFIQQDPSGFAGFAKLSPDTRIEHFTIENLSDLSAAVERVGKLAGNEQLGRQKRNEFEDRLAQVRQRVKGLPGRSVLFLTPDLMCAGSGSVISELIELAGGANAAASHGYGGWTVVGRENILAMGADGASGPDVIIQQIGIGSGQDSAQSVQEQERQARKFWQASPSPRAVAEGRLFLVADRRWTIPSMVSVDLAQQLADMIHAGQEGYKPFADHGQDARATLNHGQDARATSNHGQDARATSRGSK